MLKYVIKIHREVTAIKTVPTKERILDAALTLFAERGYDGTGVDLIAENAGLKGPSIYKHFKGKEDILDALIGKAAGYYEMNFGSKENPGKIPSDMDELIELSLQKIKFTLNDPVIRKVRRLLTMEQFRNHRIAMLATKHNIDSVQGMYSQLFSGMMNKGTLRQGDPDFLSVIFAAPVTLLIQMYDREPLRKEEAVKRIEEHFRKFAEEYGVK